MLYEKKLKMGIEEEGIVSGIKKLFKMFKLILNAYESKMNAFFLYSLIKSFDSHFSENKYTDRMKKKNRQS
jgi:hypothetical protein